jgi:hypothetical protein
MKPVKFNIDNPGTAELRKFAFITGLIVLLLFGSLLPWMLAYAWPVWPWLVSGALWTLGLIRADALIYIYRAWMAFGLVMGWINTRIILGLIFYLVFFPVGLIMRLLGNDPMTQKLEASIHSYRNISTPIEKNHIEKPY